MKKLFLLLVVFTLVFAGSSLAQEMSLGIGAEAGIPTGDFGNVTTFGIGGLATFQYNVNTDFALTLKSGYLSFTGKEVTGGTYPNWGAIPILAGGKYYFTPGDTRVYGSVDAGMYMFSVNSVNESDFSVVPQLGVQFKAGDKMDVDVHANYANVFATGTTISWIGFGVGLSFGM